MEEGSSEGQKAAVHGHHKRLKRWVVIVPGAVLVMAIAAGTILYIRAHSGLRVRIPQAIAEQINFPIYMPTQLPGDFEVTQTSFSFDGGVLIFKAEDSTGASIAFTEQAKPQSFDFASFYSAQLSETKNLDHVPFPSVAGKAVQGQNNVLSIVADKTWILVSSRSVFGQNDMQLIASSIKQTGI